MAEMTYTFHTHVAWWLKPYLYGLAAFCTITGKEPNLDRVTRRIDKAITVKTVTIKASP